MWNHTQPHPLAAETMNINNNQELLSYEQKLHKLLDLNPYLQYLERLFNQPSRYRQIIFYAKTENLYLCSVICFAAVNPNPRTVSLMSRATITCGMLPIGPNHRPDYNRIQ